MEAPRITKITLNMGLGEAVVNKNVLQSAATDLEKISGQKPVITRAKNPRRHSRYARVGRLAPR